MSQPSDTAPLRDFLDTLNSSLGPNEIPGKDMDALCQMLGVNGINFVGDVKHMPVESLQFCGFPDPLIDALKTALGQPSPFSDAKEKENVAVPMSDVKPTPSSTVAPMEIADGCSACHTPWQQNEERVLHCLHRFCSPCINKHINDRVSEQKAVGITCLSPSCSVELGDSIIRKCLLPREYDIYLEKTLESFTEQDESTFSCPNPKCTSIIGVQMDEVVIDPNVPITEEDDYGKKLTPESYRHFRNKRIRCRQCQANFCAECKTLPYHKGFTCEQFVEYGESRHCRFCHDQLTAENTVINPASPALADVCTQEECTEKSVICCEKRLPCGCPCNGIRGEAECPKCLKCELKINEEYCPICYCEALEDAPCISLGCNHVLHYQCVKNKINAGYSGARIGFSYLECHCKQIMTHPALTAVLKSHLAMRDSIKRLSMTRLKHENRLKDKPLLDRESPYFQDPQAYALHLFLFFMCFKCHKPYFAGGYECGGNEADFDPADLVCGACQPQPENVKECKTHGKEWVTFKCKYCCQVANFFCWGNTHFCNNCHVPGTWQKLVHKQSGKNKQSIWDYKQCSSLVGPVNKIRNQKNITAAQKEERFRALRCNPKNCPIAQAHPPNGFEYGLGCSMCAQKRSEDQTIERKALALGKGGAAGADKNRVMLVHHHDFDENGVLYYLGTNGKTRAWQNPATSGTVRVTSAKLPQDSAPASAFVGRSVERLVTENSANSWFIVDLRSALLRPTHYTLRHYSTWNTEALRSWRLSGSVDGKQLGWDTLIEHRDDSNLNTKGGSHTWAIPSANVKKPYRFFCLIQTGKNSNGNNFLACSGIELYGELYKKK